MIAHASAWRSEHVVAEFVLAKHHLLILNRSRSVAPNLGVLDRLIAGFCSLWIKPNRLRRAAIAFKQSTLLNFHCKILDEKLEACGCSAKITSGSLSRIRSALSNIGQWDFWSGIATMAAQSDNRAIQDL